LTPLLPILREQRYAQLRIASVAGPIKICFVTPDAGRSESAPQRASEVQQ
jgi:hypothetical protein